MDEKNIRLLDAWKEILDTEEALAVFNLGGLQRKILSSYLIHGKKETVIGQQLGLTRFRVRQLLESSVSSLTARFHQLPGVLVQLKAAEKENEELRKKLGRYEQEEAADALNGLQELSPETLALPIEKLGLDTRTFNSLNFQRIKTVRDILRHTPGDLAGFRNMGNKSLQNLRRQLELVGVFLD